MPHECTSCGRVFQDGSKEMLSGCPECGGNKFQYRPRGRTEEGSSPSPNPNAEARGGGGPGSDPNAGTDAASAAATDAASGADPEEPAGGVDPSSGTGEPGDDSVVERRSRREPGRTDASGRSGADGDGDGPEDRAQADARRGVVTPEELDAAATPSRRAPDAAPEGDAAAGADGDADRPSIDQLRQELNDQFESIRIVSPGKYELNLMELYNREEYVISLQEDGRYVIEVPESWRRPDDDA